MVAQLSGVLQQQLQLALWFWVPYEQPLSKLHAFLATPSTGKGDTCMVYKLAASSGVQVTGVQGQIGIATFKLLWPRPALR